MHKRNIRHLYILTCIFLLIFLATSCRKKEEKPALPKNMEQIQMLTDMDEKIEDIVKDIEGQLEAKKKAQETQKNQSNGQNQNKGNQEQEKQKGNEGGQNKQQGNQGQGMEQKENENWEKINKSIEDLHKTWNSYEPKAIEDGIREEDITKFEETLNQLTVIAEQKDYMSTLNEVNNLTLYLANFFDFYKKGGDSEILRIKHYVRKVHISAQNDKWNEAEANANKAMATFERLEQRMKKDKTTEEALKKLKFSLEDMKNSIKDKNEELLKIKRDIVLSNLEAVKKAGK